MNRAARVKVPLARLMVLPLGTPQRLRVAEHACDAGDRLMLTDGYGGEAWFDVLEGTDATTLVIQFTDGRQMRWF